MPESVIVLDSGQEFILISDGDPTTDTFVIYGGGPKGDQGIQGPIGPQGVPGAYVGWTGTEYPDRPLIDEPVLWIGPENPISVMADGDAWVNTETDDPIEYPMLADLADVTTAGLGDRKVLTYSGTLSKWMPGDLDLGNLTDVDLSVPAEDHQALVYDVGIGKWVPGDVATGSGGGYTGARGYTPPIEMVYSESGTGNTTIVWNPVDVQAGDIAILALDSDNTGWTLPSDWATLVEHTGLIASFYGNHSGLFMKEVTADDAGVEVIPVDGATVFAVQYFRNVSYLTAPVETGNVRTASYTIPGGYASGLAARVVALVGTSITAATNIDFPDPYEDLGTGFGTANVRLGWVNETQPSYTQSDLSGPNGNGLAYKVWSVTLVSLADSPGTDWSFPEETVQVGYDKDTNSTSTRNSLGCYIWLNTSVILTTVRYDVRNADTYSLWVDDVRVSPYYTIPAATLDFPFQVNGELVLTPTGHKFEIRGNLTSNFYYKSGGEGTAFTEPGGSQYITKWEVQIGGSSNVPFRLEFRPGIFKPASLTNDLLTIKPLDETSLHGVYGDDFQAGSLALKWNRVGYINGDQSWTDSGLVLETPRAAGNYYYQTPPVGDFTLTYKGWHTGDGVFWGLAVLNDSHTGVAVGAYDGTGGTGMIGAVTAGSYTAGTNLLTGNSAAYFAGGGEYYLRLRKSGGNYYGSVSLNGLRWSKEQIYTPTAFTPTRIGFGGFTGTAKQVGVERFNLL